MLGSTDSIEQGYLIRVYKMSDRKLAERSKSRKREKNSNVYMFNALWFKADGGEQRYREYMKAVGPLMRRAGGRKLRSFVSVREVIGDFDADLIFFVEYPDWQAFKNFANDPDHHKVAYLREEALEKSVLLRCARPDKAFKT